MTIILSIIFIIICVFFSLIFQKFDFLNRVFNNNIVLYSSFMIFSIAIFPYVDLFSSTIWVSFYYIAIYIALISVFAYVINLVLSKFNFSLKNKTLKSTVSMAHLSVSIFWGYLFMKTGIY